MCCTRIGQFTTSMQYICLIFAQVRCTALKFVKTLRKIELKYKRVTPKKLFSQYYVSLSDLKLFLTEMVQNL